MILANVKAKNKERGEVMNKKLNELANVEIRILARTKKVPMRLVFQELGISQRTFTRRMSEELSIMEKLKIVSIIDEIAASRGGES